MSVATIGTDLVKCPHCNRDVPAEPARDHRFQNLLCPQCGKTQVPIRPFAGTCLPTPSVSGPTNPIPPLPWDLTPPPGMTRAGDALGQRIVCPDCGGVATVGDAR